MSLTIISVPVGLCPELYCTTLASQIARYLVVQSIIAIEKCSLTIMALDKGWPIGMPNLSLFSIKGVFEVDN